MVNGKIKVLVVDDSLVFRNVIARGITTDPNIEVVATAADPFEARDKLLVYHPHIMICDVHMPKMNGIEFLRRLLPQYSIPVIIISSVSTLVFDALNAGAIDFIKKPDTQLSSIELFIEDLIAKIKVAAKAKIVHHMSPAHQTSHVHENAQLNTKTKLIAIGASTGGTEAIATLLQGLPNDVPGIVIVQHIPPYFSKMFAERLNQMLPFKVKEAETGDQVEPGTVLIAPGDKHLKVIRMGEHLQVECKSGNKVNGHCPSVDVLYESVAESVGKQAIGIILTGMGYDGAKGLLSMRRKGARTIGQDEQSSVVYGMPKVAFDVGAVEKQSPLAKIPDLLMSWLKV